jgi:hypothetical protein
MASGHAALAAGRSDTRRYSVVERVASLREVDPLQFDLGFQGFGLLIVIALIFGVVAQVVAGRRADTHWLWLIAATGWFIGGLFASEVVWGGATEQELQPIIDGLALDESLLGGLIGGLTAVIVTLLVTGLRPSHRTTSP